MNFYRKEIAGSLKLLKSIIKKDNSQCIAGVLYDNGRLIADNLALRMEIKLDVQETLTDDKFILPLKAIDYIESLGGDQIDIDTTEKEIVVRSGFGKARFAKISPKDFPDAPKITETGTLKIAACDFTMNVKKVLHACASVNSDRNLYTGVLLKSTFSGIDLVACDGFRIARTTMPGNSEQMNVVLPKDAIEKVIQLDMIGELEIVQSATKVVFRNDVVTIYSGILSGNFMDYEKIFRADSSYKQTVDKAMLLSSLKRAKLFANTGNSKAAINITRKHEKMLSISVDTAVEAFEESISFDGDLPEDFSIAFNVNYLSDAVQQIEGDAVTFGMENSVSPMKIEENTYHALILPVRIKNGE